MNLSNPTFFINFLKDSNLVLNIKNSFILTSFSNCINQGFWVFTEILSLTHLKNATLLSGVK
jgi:hypothetical protein